MKYSDTNWLVETYGGNGEEEFCMHVDGFETLGAAVVDMADQLDKYPNLEVRLILVTEAMRDEWRTAELEQADQFMLDCAR